VRNARPSSDGENGPVIRGVRRPCPLCGSTAAATLFQNRIAPTADFDFSTPIVRCESCDGAYAGRTLAAADLNRYYSSLSKYDLHVKSSDISPLDRERAMLARNFLAPVIGSVSSVLDVGCSAGVLLNELREAGVKHVRGIDPAANASAAAKTMFDIAVSQAQAETYDGYGNFDLVCLMAVLEHLLHPARLLSEIGRQLRPGGRVLVEVPDAGAFDRPGDARPIETFGEFSNEHINFMSITDIRRLAQAAGMEVERWQTWRLAEGAPGLFALLRRAAAGADAGAGAEADAGAYNGAGAALPRPDAGSSFSRSTSADSLQKYLARCESGMEDLESRLAAVCGGPVLVYGAGNHTGRLLMQSPALARAHVLAVLDRNRHLHGLRIGGCSILPPAALREFPPVPVIISTFNARREIHRSLRAASAQPLVLLYD
jgi:SAM-dependent methyltransferase